MPYYAKDPKRDHNFDNHPYYESVSVSTSISIKRDHNFGNLHVLVSVVLEGPAFDACAK